MRNEEDEEVIEVNEVIDISFTNAVAACRTIVANFERSDNFVNFHNSEKEF